MTERYAAATVLSSADSALHADAAATIGSEPGPEYIMVEVTSGGNDR